MQTLLYYSRTGEIVKTSGVALTYSRLNGDYPLHGHDYYEFEAVVSGEGEHIINGVSRHAAAGDCWALSPGDYHRVNCDKMELINLRFYKGELPDSFKAVLDATKFPKCGNLGDGLGEFIRLTDKFAAAGGSGVYKRYERLSLAMLALLTILNSLGGGGAGLKETVPEYVKAAADYVYERYFEPIKLEDAARAVNVSPCYLSGLFIKHAGCGFKDFLCRVRVEKAKKALLNLSDGVQKIASDCGFGTVSTMDRAFKRITGETPLGFRKNGK